MMMIRFLAGVFHRHLDVQRGIVVVAVEHRVNGRFMRTAMVDMEALILVQSCLGGQSYPRLLPPLRRYSMVEFRLENSAVLCFGALTGLVFLLCRSA
jgi:hypothetical protein